MRRGGRREPPLAWRCRWFTHHVRLRSLLSLSLSLSRSYGKLLREMYNLGDDMSVLSKNLEKAKSEQAKKLIRGFKDELRAADGPVFQKDFAALSKAVSSTNGELAEYMALFQDVPDEI